MFVKAQLLKAVGGVPEVDIFEDSLLSYKLAAKTAGRRLSYISRTSAQRFVMNGFFRQALLNQILKLGFYFGVSDRLMDSMYESEGLLSLVRKRKSSKY